ncbi:class I SAM-dependent methyltransferase [Sphingomonas canadensis]|uniref:Class I SAM-dependent methyltransferase n=1 Tax=Sphingomonas canadensis TaxID=1219257 RepID=A0ABW3H953_9SPHN|nr:class I SAM-dependent methyltransferase [Sphingomonas canadensis]MCW3837115.1 class I SAM-dependent methyltransferase [Sphingomonas canadensis]
MNKGKLSTRNLDRLCRDFATTERTLVVHSEDVDYAPYFPNAYTVTKRRDVPADMHVDIHYLEMSKIPSESYPVILCTGLLEHVPDPSVLIGEFHRILQPGGKLILGASAIFSFHEAPDNFFHFTPYGFRLLFKDWDHIEMLRGASQPFETIGILLQRINMQCDIFPPMRPIVALMSLTMRFFDLFVIAQYNTVSPRDRTTLTDSMLPSNMHAVAVK